MSDSTPTAPRRRPAARAIAASLRALAHLPLPVLYAMTAPLAAAAHHLIHYRQGVVRQNLAASFPLASSRQLRRIEGKFYKWLGRWTADTLKLAALSPAEARSRMRFEGLDSAVEALRRGQHVSLFLGHYANWEWVSSLPLHLPAGVIATQIYHPLENAEADSFLLKARGRFGAISLPMQTAPRQLLEFARHSPTITGYIADQAPGARGVLHWTDFLHHDTAFYTGAERLSAHLHAAAFYLDVQQERPGHYLVSFVPLCADAATLAPGELTEAYARALERTIQRRPELWLWSHRRWKRPRTVAPEAK